MGGGAPVLTWRRVPLCRGEQVVMLQGARQGRQDSMRIGIFSVGLGIAVVGCGDAASEQVGWHPPVEVTVQEGGCNLPLEKLVHDIGVQLDASVQVSHTDGQNEPDDTETQEDPFLPPHVEHASISDGGSLVQDNLIDGGSLEAQEVGDGSVVQDAAVSQKVAVRWASVSHIANYRTQGAAVFHSGTYQLAGCSCEHLQHVLKPDVTEVEGRITIRGSSWTWNSAPLALLKENVCQKSKHLNGPFKASSDGIIRVNDRANLGLRYKEVSQGQFTLYLTGSNGQWVCESVWKRT